MDSILLQKQVRNNASDLQDFYKEICEWGDEMKKKDDLLKKDQHKEPKEKKHFTKKAKKPKVEQVKKPIRGFDYTAWDKFDVEAECAKLDKEEKAEISDDSGDLSDEFDETAREQAILEKEKGNTFVKAGKWEDAIKHYTQAIQLYGYDPVFYANRSLCHLKMNNLKAAESDCTVALQLDKTYVKAYQRRAAAREGLNQLKEAREDLLKVFDYEPNNKESKQAFAKLEKKMNEMENKASTCSTESTQRPKSKFTISRSQQKQKTENISRPDVNSIKVQVEEKPTSGKQDADSIATEKSTKQQSRISESENRSNIWGKKEAIQIIQPIFKPPHMRSKKALKRIDIRETDISDKKNIPTDVKAPDKDSASKMPLDGNTLICDDLKVIERKPSECQQHIVPKKLKRTDDEMKKQIFTVPSTSVQFISDWKVIHSEPEQRYLYLKQIDPVSLPDIFKDSLESNIFSDVIKCLAEDFIRKGAQVYSYMKALTLVRRFATLIMFMSHEDKNYLLQLFDYMKKQNNVPMDDINYLMKQYEM